MTYDNTDTNADGKIDAPVDNDSVSTGERTHGRDVTDELGVKSISPSVSDLGSAIKSAISELAPEGGRIKLPKGSVSTATTVSFDPGTDNQERQTPIIIEGHGAPADEAKANAEGTLIDAAGLSSPAFERTSTSHAIHLRDFAVLHPETADALSFRNGATRLGSIQNVLVDGDFSGSGWGMDLKNFFGSQIGTVQASACEKGVLLENCNASRIQQVTARLNQSTTTPPIVVLDMSGGSIGTLYSESNEGAGVSFAGTIRGVSVDNLYVEENNKSGSIDREVVLGDSGVDAGVTTQIEIHSAQFNSSNTAFGSERFTIDLCDRGGIASTTGVPDVFATTDRASAMTWMNNKLGDVDTSNGNGGTWINNNITGTVSKASGATTVSGD